MQIENIPERPLAWWTTEQEEAHTVGYRLLGQVIIDNQNMLAIIHELLPLLHQHKVLGKSKGDGCEADAVTTIV